MLETTREAVANLGARSLRQLLFDLEKSPQDRYWGFETDNPDGRARISRAASQLIESLGWLDCQEETFHRLKRLTQFLTQQAAEDPDRVYLTSDALTASRLKSILQYYSHESTVFRDHDAMKNSLSYLLRKRFWLADAAVYERLCTTDLFGYFITQAAPLIHPSSVLREPSFAEEMNEAYSRLLESVELWREKALDEWASDATRRTDHPKDFSFAIWLIFVSNGYGPRKNALHTNELLSDLDHLYEAANAVGPRQTQDKSYNPTLFNKFVYPRLFLSWACRKQPEFRDRYDLEDFYRWFLPTAESILDGGHDPYLVGLVLKLCTAAAKDDVRRHFREESLQFSMSFLHDASARKDEATREMLTRVIRHRLSVHLERPERLTGGWSPAHVWRAQGVYRLPLGGDDDRPFSFIVKTGPRDNFIRAARLYQALGHQAQRLFPHHDPEPSAITDPSGTRFYMIMQELEGFEPLAKRIIRQITPDKTAAINKKSIYESVQLGLEAIAKLHRVAEPEQPAIFPRQRSSQSKIAEMYTLIEDLQARHSQLRMRMLLQKEIRIGDVEVSSINWLLRKMLNGVGRIVPKIEGSRFATVHGDCHANNLMLPEKGKDAVFIDIDGLQRGDYLQDYAEFYCHLCLSLDLEIVVGQNIQLQVSESGKTALLVCDYADPRFWDIQRNIAGLIAEAVRREAKARGDSAAMPRLALLIANRILFVASKSQQASKAAILLSRGLGFLENVYRWLPKVDKEPVPVPFTSLSAEDMRGIWAEDG